jgi:Skp family chaperone for outer membrane proteins
MRSRPVFSALLAALVLVAAFTSACKPSPRAVARATEAGAVEARKSFASVHAAGDLSDAEFKRIDEALYRIETSARVLNYTLVNYDSMKPRSRRETLVRFANELSFGLDELDAAGVVTNEKVRLRLDRVRRDLRVGVAVLNVIAAGLAEPTQADVAR